MRGNQRSKEDVQIELPERLDDIEPSDFLPGGRIYNSVRELKRGQQAKTKLRRIYQGFIEAERRISLAKGENVDLEELRGYVSRAVVMMYYLNRDNSIHSGLIERLAKWAGEVIDAGNLEELKEKNNKFIRAFEAIVAYYAA